ncbi:hypothetical protein M153_2749000357 [Pseudoloma neurophilia]|uniref:Uncharacterized protein n=1 Tax=Pseudoloma neurophilia TaxID=146866 RepID=A0A0R0M004_9MICR|nr:hypothetical protein M153_2749000357 [Pseudoloma neurophilia]
MQREIGCHLKEVKWSNAVALAQLNALISFEILELLENAIDTNSLFEQLLELKYNPSLEIFYEDMLTKTKQSEYRYIKDYHKEIKEIVKRLAVYVKMSENERDR